MADVVQLRVERMVPELEDLERLKLFSREEIREIKNKRLKFEYRLERPSPLKQDFLSYIDYETHLDSLRRLRKKMSQSAGTTITNQNQKRKRKSLSDFSILRRILELYAMAVSRFKGDVNLWFRYLEFCRTRRNGKIKKALTQVMRLHPKVAGVWIYAAAWEFDHNLGVTTARNLMLRGLRHCPTSEDLWIEYLRMELTYFNKLKARGVSCLEDKGSIVPKMGDKAEDQWRDENQGLFLSLNEETGGDSGGDVGDGDTKKRKDMILEAAGTTLDVIYSGAVEAIPSSFSLRKRFFEILDSIELTQSKELRQKVLVDMRRDFSGDPAYWDWLARLEISDESDLRVMDEHTRRSEVQKAAKVYEEGLDVLPSVEVFNLYVKFLVGIIDLWTMESQNGESSDEKNFYVSQLIRVYERAESLGCITEEGAAKHILLLLELGRLDDSRNVAEKLCCGKFSSSVQLLCLQLSIELRCLAMDRAHLDTIFGLLRDALKKAPVSEAEQLWLMALKHFANRKIYFAELVEIAFVLLVKFPCDESRFCLSSAIVNFVLTKEGVEEAREVYKRFLALPGSGVTAYRTCIELESNLASAGDKDCLAKARNLYETALIGYDQDSSLWNGYYNLEMKLGTTTTAAAVQRRAQKTLKDASAFSGRPNWQSF
ncbi:hypothetical protein MLD38_010545 [Melastoma candidum]|uniref:Uncharacterized protein n=1 Tax=Melastoma candidum TaxID=119954 RepID=A0ACB9R0B2_9MYRT|nr:hypothetical protein MLD38_010545 [Melastoma candidum]